MKTAIAFGNCARIKFDKSQVMFSLKLINSDIVSTGTVFQPNEWRVGNSNYRRHDVSYSVLAGVRSGCLINEGYTCSLYYFPEAGVGVGKSQWWVISENNCYYPRWHWNAMKGIALHEYSVFVTFYDLVELIFFRIGIKNKPSSECPYERYETQDNGNER